ncbi:DUF3570 domain-containing protein [Fibrella aquatilis]|uniref:DUF3570 domain-containing protein n=1 Tax=Fibrella aquatilis TaxID=2817059 RepID=A0A939G7Y7_9BACT|nr:DUF3570 domain-containing protein [Fibrella aquatilis]MBO0932040.1 DUF3570 domain-containing protein [Fibrella aquatilis]
MKKFTLTVALLLAGLVGRAQTQPAAETGYEARQLKIEEINFVSNYYHQEGNNSAVTGGIGTEKLTNYANSFDLVLSKIDRFNRVHTLSIDANIDYYTSASSDNIDPLTISSASKSDIHFYPSVTWRVADPRTRISRSLGYSYSREYDYQSHGFTAQVSKTSADNNREVSVRGSAFFDTWKAILPSELRPANYGSGAHNDRAGVDYKPRNSFNMALSLSQVVNKRLQLLVVLEPSLQQGLLSTPFHRVYFTDGSERIERLPGTRLKLPIGLRANYFYGDRVIIRSFYRFYVDDWGMQAHTANLEVPVKLTPFLSISPFYRFHTQTAVSFFRPYGGHDPNLLYHTSDYDIGNISTQFIGTGIRMAPPGGVLGIRAWNALELRYGHYTRSTGMVANSLTLLVKVK